MQIALHPLYLYWFSGLSYVGNCIKSLRKLAQHAHTVAMQITLLTTAHNYKEINWRKRDRNGKRQSWRQRKQGVKEGSLLMTRVCGMRDSCELSLADRIKDQWPS